MVVTLCAILSWIAATPMYVSFEVGVGVSVGPVRILEFHLIGMALFHGLWCKTSM